MPITKNVQIADTQPAVGNKYYVNAQMFFRQQKLMLTAGKFTIVAATPRIHGIHESHDMENKNR